ALCIKSNILKKWKFLFAFVAFITFLELVGLPFKENLKYSDFLSVIVSASTLIPIYGYAYGVAIGNKTIAILIFVLNVLIFGGISLLWLVLYTFNQFSLIQLLFSLGAFAFLLFVAYPVYMYAFRSDALWSENA
ncbi:hypothetical protein, partial [Pseudoalteromonas sp. MTN2-4]|uniref:hypothetical protein n=1 Tax=Pseudoalteromonas sp. MTN2-4 TaxID=3056555 RepID=UPI0036F32744